MWHESDAADQAPLALVFVRELLSQRSAHGVLKRAAELAAEHLPGGAAVTVILPDGSVDTLSSNALALAADRAQHRSRQGPTLRACAGEALLYVPDLAVGEERWPVFARDARELGVGGVLACALGSWSGGRAALSLYADAAGAFDSAAVGRAALLAQHTLLALTQADQVASLHTALRSRQVIGEASGILMERHRLDGRAAFVLLVRASQRLNVKLRLVAEHVVLTGQDPAQITAGDLLEPATAGPHRSPSSPVPGRELHITAVEYEECTVLRVAGQVDLATRAELEAALREAAPEPGTPLILDLAEVGFCDAGGLRTLLRANRTGAERNAPLRIIPSHAVTMVIDLAGVEQVLELYPDHDHALAGQTEPAPATR